MAAATPAIPVPTALCIDFGGLPHPFTVVSWREKMCPTCDQNIIFSILFKLSNEPKNKKFNKALLRKSDFKFSTYLAMARNWSKITK